MKKFLMLTAFFVSMSANVQAKEWQIDPAHSKLSFVGEQSGEKFEGGFKKFTAQISFDPEHLETSKISVLIDAASAFAGASDRDDMLPQKDWFDTSKFPQAQFTSTAIRKTDVGQYEMSATLSIKGISHEIILPFTLRTENDHWRVQGHVGLKRTDFTIGQGMFANENYVKDKVDVIIDLYAKPVS